MNRTLFRTPSTPLRILGTAAAVGLLAAPVVVGALGAQAPQSPAPAFEVASIKPNNSGDGRVMMQNQPGRFIATNITVRMLIRNAYLLQDFQVSGGPNWLTSDHFDINAKVDDSVREAAGRGGPPVPGQPNVLQLMLRSLLADRFKLVVHNETKEQAVYALVLARADGKLGPQLKKSEVDCDAQMAAARGRGPGAPPPGPPGPGGQMPCGMRIGPGNMVAGGMRLSQFANSLGNFAGRIVLDRSGLEGAYDFTLKWTPDQMPQRPPGSGDNPIGGFDIDPNGPSLFTAIQEQLGLKLDNQRGPVDMLVIDRVEKPSEE